MMNVESLETDTPLKSIVACAVDLSALVVAFALSWADVVSVVVSEGSVCVTLHHEAFSRLAERLRSSIVVDDGGGMSRASFCWHGVTWLTLFSFEADGQAFRELSLSLDLSNLPPRTEQRERRRLAAMEFLVSADQATATDVANAIGAPKQSVDNLLHGFPDFHRPDDRFWKLVPNLREATDQPEVIELNEVAEVAEVAEVVEVAEGEEPELELAGGPPRWWQHPDSPPG